MDEIYNNPNLHSEEQDELEIPDSKLLQNYMEFFLKKKYLLLLVNFLLLQINYYINVFFVLLFKH